MKSNDIKILDNGWMEVPFSYMAEHISKRVDPKDTDLDIYIGLEHIDSGSLKIKRCGKPEDVKGTKLIAQPGDIIFGKRRAYQGKVGVCEWDAIVSAHSMVLRPREENIEKNFLKFFMQSEEFYNRSIQISEGSLSPTIKWKVLEGQRFIIPSKDQQTMIVQHINIIENQIYAYEQLLEKSKKYNEKLQGELLSKGIGKKTYIDSTHGKYPSDWEIRRMGEIGEFKTSSVDKKIKDDEKVIKLLNYMDVYNNSFITNHNIEYMEVTAKESQINNNDLRKGDILFTPTSETPDDIGHSAMVVEDLENTLYSYHLVRYRLNIDIDHLFMGYCFRSKNILKQFYKRATGSTRFTLSIEDFNKTLLAYPKCKDEQRKIGEILFKLEKSIENTEEMILKTLELKKIVVKELMQQ